LMLQPTPKFWYLIYGVILVACGDQDVGIEEIQHHRPPCKKVP
jgi:hypothetical protein